MPMSVPGSTVSEPFVKEKHKQAENVPGPISMLRPPAFVRTGNQGRSKASSMIAMFQRRQISACPSGQERSRSPLVTAAGKAEPCGPGASLAR
jgi:hypothetical protein